MIVPGWGQLSTPRRSIGRVLVFTTGIGAIGALTLFLFVEPDNIAAWLANPDAILLVVVLNIVVGLVRVVSAEHAWRASGGGGVAVTVVVAIFVAVPHVAVAWVGLETRDSLEQIFWADPAPVAAPVAAPTTTTTTTMPVQLEPVTSAPGQFGDDVITVSVSDPWRPFGEDRLNILLLGGDAGPGRGGLRTDTMIVVSADPLTGDVAMFGIPRNFGGITLSDGTEVPVRRINHVYWWGRANPDRFEAPDPGAAAITDAIGYMTGLNIDHHALVDLTGFADVVDVLGGVELNVPRRVDGPLYDPSTGEYEMIVIEPGTQMLDGGRALAYARARYGSSDYSRMARQRCILAAMAHQVDPLEILANLGTMLDTVEDNVSTDIPSEKLPDLVRMLLNIDARQARLLGFDSTWRSGWTDDKHPIPDVGRIREAVRATIEDPGTAQGLGAATAEDACG